jgi:hypothetical protein
LPDLQIKMRCPMFPQRYLSDAQLRAFGVLDADGKPILDLARDLKTVEQGAATSVWCATSPQLDGMGGVYCENSDIAPLTDIYGTGGSNHDSRLASTAPTGVMPFAVDPAAADRLWSLSERLLDC